MNFQNKKMILLCTLLVLSSLGNAYSNHLSVNSIKSKSLTINRSDARHSTQINLSNRYNFVADAARNTVTYPFLITSFY